MQQDYARFLDYRATQRQLASQFARPRLLLLHVLAFVVVMTAIWAYGTGANLWRYYDNLILPNVAGAVWSLALVGHALWHFRRSAALHAQRERAVEAEMRAYIARNPQADSDALFEMHRALERDLEAQGRWSLSLTVFALVNTVSWTVALFNPQSSWSLQTTPMFAVVLIGGLQSYLLWQQQRTAGRASWFTRFPLHHVFAFLIGTVVLGLLGMFRAINPWDINTLVGWGLVLLLASVGWNVVLQPVGQWVVGRFTSRQAQPSKRKPDTALTLGDDGELTPVDELLAAQDDDALYDDVPPLANENPLHRKKQR